MATEAQVREALKGVKDPEIGRPIDEIGMMFGAFSDLAENVARQVDILRTHPFLRRVPVHGLVFDVANGRLHEIA